ncbi:MAG TPA: S1/P1 nuclease [Steroidobacteraceae bacterium]
MLQRSLAVLLLGVLPWPSIALAWGDEGHEVVALIAEHYLDPAARTHIEALLATDRSGLVADTSMAGESVWADRYRDSDRDAGAERYQRTRRWHYVDLELGAPDLSAACFGHEPLPAGVPAASGPARSCVVDKIGQFADELARPASSAPERLLALQFLLHLIGDVHQPLHAADDHDQGGNLEQVAAGHRRRASLHHYWDQEFVRRLGAQPDAVSRRLLAQIDAKQLADWQRGDAADWARESFELARRVAYGPLLPVRAHGRYRLSAAYVDAAVATVQLQLCRAGVRLAWVLNRSLR